MIVIKVGDDLWGGGVGPPLAAPGVRPGSARVAAEGQAQEAALTEPAMCDEFRSPARSALPGHRREGGAVWAPRKSCWKGACSARHRAGAAGSSGSSTGAGPR